MRLRRWIPCAALALAVSAADARAQDRAALIGQARNEFSDSAVVELLLDAMAPALGAPDSLWAVAGYDLALALERMNRQELAQVWLRMLARHGAAWPPDPAWYPSRLVDAYADARGAVAAGGPADPVPTEWAWPAAFDADAAGTVRITHEASGDPVAITVEGREGTGSGSVELPAGTWSLVAAADGYEPVSVTREVLPGVSTRLTVHLPPLLPAETRAAVAAQLVRITWSQAGQQRCSNGFLASDDGLVITALGPVQAGGFRVAGADGRDAGPARVAATDPAQDLAVLRVDSGRAGGLPSASGMTDGQYAWAVHLDGCGDIAHARTRIPSWPGTPVAPVALDPALPGSAGGAPLVDRSGRLIGVVRGATVVPELLTRDLLERARRDVVASVQVAPQRGGGFPWLIVGGGAAAAGLALALLGGGGGNGDTGPPVTPPPTTGGIIVTFPN